MDSWALDLGTTNTGVARWNDAAGRPELVALPSVCRRPEGEDPLEAPLLVPSVVQFIEGTRLIDRIGQWRFFRSLLLGRTALIGRPALERNQGLVDPGFVPAFKAALGPEPLRPVARCGRRSFSVRDAAHAFLRELLGEVKRETGGRIRSLVVTVPVDAYETYRAEVQEALRRVGVPRVRFVDEPLAAALGYGLGLHADRQVLVIDIGGGTLHVALVRLGPARTPRGQADVLAKEGRSLGGNAVDGWILENVCRRMDYALEDDPEREDLRLWRRLMLAEACRVKEAVYFQPSSEFLLTPPGLSRRIDPRLGGPPPVTLTRDDLVQVLREAGFYSALGECIDRVLAQSLDGPVASDAVDAVLMVGGSTLLPGVFPMVEERFGRHRVRAWHPFESVAHGAASFAAQRFAPLDFVVHDYAFMTHDPHTHEPVHTVVVPRGTRFPTAPDLWKGQVLPTCSLGEKETIFKLLICEIGRGDGNVRRFVWDAAGALHSVGGQLGSDGRVVVPLNDASPTLGHLDPPHSARDRRPRLEVSFGVNADRWLIATVHDLLTRRTLMEGQPVVRLL